MGTEPPLSPAPASPSQRQWALAVAAPAAAVALLVLAVGLLLYFFQQIPIEGTTLAIDWRGLWAGLRANPPLFGNDTGLRIAPWDVLLVKPLGWLPFRASWGMLTLLTLAVLVISVPQSQSRARLWLGCLLLVSSFPALREFADGNFEGLVIAGLLLIVYGYRTQSAWLLAAGLLMATAKAQEVWVLALVLGVYLLRAWPTRRLILLGGLLASVLILSLLWQGREWIAGALSIQERGTLVDSSLWTTLTRLGWPVWAVAMAWVLLAVLVALYAWRSGPTLSREKAAILLATSLLLSPYAAGDSFLTVLAIGIIPLLLNGNLWAMLLLLLADLPYLASRQLLYFQSASYWTALLVLTAGLLAGQAWYSQRQKSAELVIGPANA